MCYINGYITTPYITYRGGVVILQPVLLLYYIVIPLPKLNKKRTFLLTLDILFPLCLLLTMPLSKARDRVRKRLLRGSPPVPTSDFELLPKCKRKEILAELAMKPEGKPITAGHRIAAIKEINLMEHVYDPYPSGNDNRTYNIIIQGNREEELEKMNQLFKGKIPELEAPHIDSEE